MNRWLYNGGHNQSQSEVNNDIAVELSILHSCERYFETYCTSKDCCTPAHAPMTAALSQQDSIPQEATKSNQKQHEEHNKEHKALTWAPGTPNLMELLQDAPKKARSPENKQQPEEQLPAPSTPQETTRGFIAVV